MIIRATLVLLILSLVGCGTPQRRPNETASRPKEAAETNVHLAANYFNAGRVELALEKAERALELDPTLPMAHSMAGVINESIGNHERAGDHYQRAVELDGLNADALNNYGQFLCKRGEMDEGIVHLEKAVAQPFYATPAAALTNAGDCAERKSDARQAEQFYRRALAIDAVYPDALFRLSRLLLAKGEAFRARAFLQRLESASRPSPEALALGARIERALGDEDAGREYEIRLKQLFPDASGSRRP